MGSGPFRARCSRRKPAPRGSLWEAAQTLRLPLQGTFRVVAAEAHELGHDPLPRAESALAVLDVRSIWRLEADVSVSVLSLPVRTRLDGLLAVLRRHATARVGVSRVFIELREAAWALRLARLALPASKEKTGVNQFDNSPLTVLVAAAPQVALDTARAVLGTLLDLPKDDRDLLLSTFEAWLRAGGSATATGCAGSRRKPDDRSTIPGTSPSSSPPSTPGASYRTRYSTPSHAPFGTDRRGPPHSKPGVTSGGSERRA